MTTEVDEYGNSKYIFYTRQCECEGRYGSACWDCGSEDGTYQERVLNEDYCGQVDYIERLQHYERHYR